MDTFKALKLPVKISQRLWKIFVSKISHNISSILIYSFKSKLFVCVIEFFPKCVITFNPTILGTT